jgi:hypothetical protein
VYIHAINVAIRKEGCVGQRCGNPFSLHGTWVETSKRNNAEKSNHQKWEWGIHEYFFFYKPHITILLLRCSLPSCIKSRNITRNWTWFISVSSNHFKYYVLSSFFSSFCMIFFILDFLLLCYDFLNWLYVCPLLILPLLPLHVYNNVPPPHSTLSSTSVFLT